MPDKRKAPGAPESAHRRKRAAPTIDLTATEIPAPASSEPAPPESASPPPQAAAEPLASEPAADPLPHEAMNEAPAEPPPLPPPPPEEPVLAASDALPPERVASEQAPPPAHGGANWFSALVAGLAGGIVVAIVLGALWYSGMLPAGTPQPTDTSAQIAALQKQIQDLQNRPASTSAPAIDTKAIDAINSRVAKIENTLASLPKGNADVAQRLAAAENAMKSLGLALTALNKRSDDTAANAAQARAQAEAAEKAVTDLRGSVQSVEKSASTAVAPAELDALQQRIAALEQSAKSAREEIAKTAAAEKAARLALSATALRNAVTSGAPFQAELKQAKSLGADDKTLAALAPFAATGVPSAAALAQELRGLIPAMLKVSGAQAPQTGGFLERLQANASKLVRIQPVDAPAGDDPSNVLARIEIAAAHADIAAALADLAKLPEPARAPALDWIKKANARQAALAAARDFAADSARSLSQP